MQRPQTRYNRMLSRFVLSVFFAFYMISCSNMSPSSLSQDTASPHSFETLEQQLKHHGIRYTVLPSADENGLNRVAEVMLKYKKDFLDNLVAMRKEANKFGRFKDDPNKQGKGFELLFGQSFSYENQVSDVRLTLPAKGKEEIGKAIWNRTFKTRDVLDRIFELCIRMTRYNIEYSPKEDYLNDAVLYLTPSKRYWHTFIPNIEGIGKSLKKLNEMNLFQGSIEVKFVQWDPEKETFHDLVQITEYNFVSSNMQYTLLRFHLDPTINPADNPSLASFLALSKEAIQEILLSRTHPYFKVEKQIKHIGGKD